MNPIVTKHILGGLAITLNDDDAELVAVTLCGSSDEAVKEIGEAIASGLDEVNR